MGIINRLTMRLVRQRSYKLGHHGIGRAVIVLL